MSQVKLRVGVVGCGLVAQVMHLPYLTELDKLFEVRALCDSSRKVVDACGSRFSVERRFTDWRRLIEEDLDAVLVSTSGTHAEIAVAAAAAGKHVFVEKPMCYSIAEGTEMLNAAERSRVVLMVGYMKRYDPAYRRTFEEVGRLHELRFVRLTTMESPLEPYVAHYPLVRGDDVEPAQITAWRADSERRVAEVLGEVSELARRTYEFVLLDTLVHELNLLRGILGEPSAVEFVSMRDTSMNVVLGFGRAECNLTWLDLPGIARYEMEVCFYDPGERVRLAFPSPFLRSAPTLVDVETGELGGVASSVSREVVSYEEPFKLELVEFHRAVTEGGEPLTSGIDGLRDVALCQSIITSATQGRAVPNPTDLSIGGLR
jgi:predicted dehydrogenase